MAEGSGTGVIASGAGGGTLPPTELVTGEKNWWDFVAEVANATDLLIDGGDPETTSNLLTVKDTDLFARFTEDNQLVGGTIVLFQRSDLGGLFDARGRAIVGYSYEDRSVTMAHAVPRPVNTSTDSTGGYTSFQIYRALEPSEWFAAVQNAVNAAWPAIFETRTLQPSGRISDGGYGFTEKFDQVLKVEVKNSDFLNHGFRVVPRARWNYDKSQTYVEHGSEYGASTDWLSGILRFSRDLPQPDLLPNIRVTVAGRYVGPLDTGDYYSAGTYPTMDHEFLMRQSMANVYGMLADATHNQASQGAYMTKMQYNQELANNRKEVVATALSTNLSLGE